MTFITRLFIAIPVAAGILWAIVLVWGLLAMPWEPMYVQEEPVEHEVHFRK